MSEEDINIVQAQAFEGSLSAFNDAEKSSKQSENNLYFNVDVLFSGQTGVVGTSASTEEQLCRDDHITPAVAELLDNTTPGKKQSAGERQLQYTIVSSSNGYRHFNL